MGAKTYRRPPPFALPPDRYPIGDVRHADFAITRLYMRSVTDDDRKTVIKAIKKRYPKNKSLMDRIKKLEAAKVKKKRKVKKKAKRKVKKKTAKKKTAKKKTAKKAPRKRKKAKKVAKKRKKKKTTKKGNRRKGQPRGARLAYDDLKKKKRKKKRKRKESGGLLEMLTSELHDF